MAWTYWFTGAILVSVAFTIITFANTDTDHNQLWLTLAVFVLSIGAMFGVSSCIVANHLF